MLLSVEMEWRPIPDFSTYEISEFGDVRRLVAGITRSKGHVHLPYVNVDGYLAQCLCSDADERENVLVHRIVALTFIGEPPEEAMEVAHRNGSKLYNHWSNLRWATRLENHDDRHLHGTNVKGIRNGNAKIEEADVHFIRREYRAIKARGSGRKVTELEDAFGICRGQVISIAKGKSWKHVPWQSV